MILSRAELKEKAKEKLNGNWGNPLVTTLIYLLISIAASYIGATILGFVAGIAIGGIGILIRNYELMSTMAELTGNLISFIVSIFIAPLTVGFLSYFLMFVKGEDAQLNNLFDGYKKSFGNSALAALLMGVYIFLWTLLLIVPGIIKTYAYSMVQFIIADDPTISASEALKKSEEMMKGHKWEFCVLQLSFLGWELLAILTCGIGFLWLTPYMQSTYSNYYINLKAEYEGNNEVVQSF